jgi:hypothetical protein
MRMRFAIVAAFLLATGAGGAAAWAEDPPSDAEIRAALLGSWIVPRDSSDFDPTTARTLETFRDDGTYLGTFYNDLGCTEVAMTVTVRWTIEHGILTSVYPNGEQSRDLVLSIGKGRVSLKSLEDGSVYIREQRSNCGQYAS